MNFNKTFRYLTIIATLIILGSLYSCKTKIVNPKMNVGDDVPFVQCYLNPNEDTISLALSIARGASDDGRKISHAILQEASVLLRHGSEEALMHFYGYNNDIALFYLESSSFPIIAGETYQLEIRHSDIIDVHAQTIIPNSTFDFAHIEKGSGPDAYGDYFYRFEASINDDPSTNNYYRLTVAEQYGLNLLQEFTTDQNNTNHNPKINFEVYEYVYHNDSTKIHVANLNEDTYKFLSRVEYILDIGGNPFAEPSSLHTNVNGGLGIFGGLQVIGRYLK